MNFHTENSVVYFASKELNRFYKSLEINPVYDYMSDFTKRESIIEGLVEAKKWKNWFIWLTIFWKVMLTN